MNSGRNIVVNFYDAINVHVFHDFNENETGPTVVTNGKNEKKIR